MTDLRLDSSGDLVLTEGLDLALVDGAEQVAQRISLVLKTFLGEWFLDVNHGTDWRGRVLGKTDASARLAYLREAVRRVRGVASVESLTASEDRATRKLTVKGSARIATGELVTFQETT